MPASAAEVSSNSNRESRVPSPASFSSPAPVALATTYGACSGALRRDRWSSGVRGHRAVVAPEPPVANAIVASSQGKDYQARMFWLQACRLFNPESHVIRVGFELNDRRAFDDVAVFYGPHMRDKWGNALEADHYSVKYHVDQCGELTTRSLIEPDFINAESVSFLQRLRNLQLQLGPAAKRTQLFLASPWRVAPSDPLGKLYDNRTEGLRIDKLRVGATRRSEMGRVRAEWREHLHLATDEELYATLSLLRIDTKYASLAALTDALNMHLTRAGLLPIPAECIATVYDDLPYKLTGVGLQEFTRDEMWDWLKREGLVAPAPAPSTRQVGIRSFMRGAERLAEVATPLACVTHLFDGRRLPSGHLWNEAVMPEVQRLADDIISTSGPHHLHMPAHTSIVFAMGYCLDPKMGADVAPVQPGPGGSAVWTPDRSATRPLDGLINVSTVAIHDGAPDVAVAIGVTHDVGEDVESFARGYMPTLGRVLRVTPTPSVSPTAVRDATHALHLAQAIAGEIRRRTPKERAGILHVFIAAPKAVTFFLGQEARSFGRVILYEYDQEANTPEAYAASISLPVAKALPSPTPS